MSFVGHSLLRVAALAAVVSTGCIEYLEPGEHGRLRYFDDIRGAAPLTLLPPKSDRDGNVYVLYGDQDLNEVQAYVGHATGGFTSACDIMKGDNRGAHGWIGRATSRAWYAAGDSLVEVDGSTGACTAILETDPTTNVGLQFTAVVPHVIESPSRTQAIALIQSSADASPYHVLVDLRTNRYSRTRQFEPTDATDVQILGVGAHDETATGFVLAKYTQGGDQRVEAIYLSIEDGSEIARATVSGLSGYGSDGIAGYLQSVDGDRVAGMTDDGALVTFDRSGGNVTTSVPFSLAGVHRWDGSLYVVGTASGQPAVSKLNGDGLPGQAVEWGAAKAAAHDLSGNVTVLDDRSTPRNKVSWTDPTSAIGPHPFLSAHSPDHYADGTTGWLVAGPSFNASGSPLTSVAFGPIGIDYP